MKVTRIRIKKWRNFRDVEMEIPEESALVCLVGENGCGKSNLLEMIAVIAAEAGSCPPLTVWLSMTAALGIAFFYLACLGAQDFVEFGSQTLRDPAHGAS